ncbi:MAG: GDSL-type esterase/lipase family protein [Rikenellaceae bacterium]
MKRFLTLLLVAIVTIASGAPRHKTKVACIGDSITFGARIDDRENNSYPAQLGVMLGSDYEVVNFGISARTLLSKGNLPYIETTQYKNMLEFKPDIAFIMLGTNDSKAMNREHIEDFEGDYKALIESIKEVSPECRIILMAPTMCHNESDGKNITPKYITNTIVKKVQKVAYDGGYEVLNLHPVFYDYVEAEMPDKIHPSAIGAKRIAERLYEHLTQDFDPEYRFKAEPDSEEFSYHGFKGYKFTHNGKSSIVVEPKYSAPDQPWVWRARFWGHEPQVDIALLERGYHIVYNDVANMFGSPAAVMQWELFYKYICKKGLEKSCVIEAISRGGLIAYNFAVKNPKAVKMIYADCPVLDIKSWPMGREEDAELAALLYEAYGFSSREEAIAYKLNPIDRCMEIAKGKYKMFHLCGDADELVPIAENTIPFAAQIESYKGDIECMYKEGVGHHPHSLKNPEPIVKRILSLTK